MPTLPTNLLRSYFCTRYIHGLLIQLVRYESSGENALDKFVPQSLSDSLALKVDALLLFSSINVAKTGVSFVRPRFCQVLKKQKL